ncbi:hypothetical protein PG985_006932 [Apiospora marii]|uniref:uncharacterized protein n=1 Tax=Apiospora marii TaxID=335849 RepID=UPI00312E30E8
MAGFDYNGGLSMEELGEGHHTPIYGPEVVHAATVLDAQRRRQALDEMAHRGPSLVVHCYREGRPRYPECAKNVAVEPTSGFSWPNGQASRQSLVPLLAVGTAYLAVAFDLAQTASFSVNCYLVLPSLARNTFGPASKPLVESLVLQFPAKPQNELAGVSSYSAHKHLHWLWPSGWTGYELSVDEEHSRAIVYADLQRVVYDKALEVCKGENSEWFVAQRPGLSPLIYGLN